MRIEYTSSKTTVYKEAVVHIFRLWIKSEFGIGHACGMLAACSQGFH
jgi:hypothetical protein